MTTETESNLCIIGSKLKVQRNRDNKWVKGHFNSRECTTQLRN